MAATRRNSHTATADVVVEKGTKGALFSTITVAGNSARLSRKDVKKMLNAIRQGRNNSDIELAGVLNESNKMMARLEAIRGENVFLFNKIAEYGPDNN